MQPFIDEQGRIVLSIHALVIETSEHTIVVDTCIGNDKPADLSKMEPDAGRFSAAFCCGWIHD